MSTDPGQSVLKTLSARFSLPEAIAWPKGRQTRTAGD